jgi:hypothetical protein
MFSVVLRHAERTRRYSISPVTASGWEVTIERDGELSRRVHYRDWHRVERALALIRLEVYELTASGWQQV